MRRRFMLAGVVALVLSCGATADGAVVRGARSSLPRATTADATRLAARADALARDARRSAALSPTADASGREETLVRARTARSSAKRAHAVALEEGPTPSPLRTRPGSGISFTDGHGNAYRVVAKVVIDPAQSIDASTVQAAHTRLVAVVFTITDTGSASTSGDANRDASVVGSNDHRFAAHREKVAGCTNFNRGEYRIGPGRSVTGCVVFQLPSNVMANKVEWSSTGGPRGTYGEWRVT